MTRYLRPTIPDRLLKYSQGTCISKVFVIYKPLLDNNAEEKKVSRINISNGLNTTAEACVRACVYIYCVQAIQRPVMMISQSWPEVL